MLERFVELHRASDEEILKYSKDWGVLGLCAHGLPASHSSTVFGKQLGFTPCEWAPSLTVSGFFCEDLAVWRRFSAVADAIIQLAGKLNRGELDESEAAWTSLLSRSGQSHYAPDWRWGHHKLLAIKRPLKRSEILQGARGYLAREIRTWLEIGKAGLSFYYDPDGGWRIIFASGAAANLFGQLALRMMFMISGKGGIVFCSSCSGAYLPNKRRPSAGRSNYCEACKADGTMWREIKRRQRSKETS